MADSPFQKISVNTVGRDFAVGDIHGSFTSLQRALDQIGFEPKTDRLFSVGDLVDRGAESHCVLDWLGKPWFYALCGNHDFMAWRSAMGDPYPHVDHLAHGGSWLSALSGGDQQAIGHRLAALPLVLEVETPKGSIGLVHADCPFDDWEQMRRVAWDQLSDDDAIVQCCLWSTLRHQRQYAAIVKNIRAVVHGHTTIPAMRLLGNVYFLDTGGWQSTGCFTFLNLHSLRPIREARRNVPSAQQTTP